MRMDVSGTVLMIIGTLCIAFVALFMIDMIDRGVSLAVLGTFIGFMGWLFILTGLSYIWEVHKDKKLRAPKPPKPVPELSINVNEGVQKP